MVGFYFSINPMPRLPAGFRWISAGELVFPAGYVFPAGTKIERCRGIATGHGRLPAGDPIEPDTLDVSGWKVLPSGRLESPTGDTEPSHAGDGGVYGPTFIYVE